MPKGLFIDLGRCDLFLTMPTAGKWEYLCVCVCKYCCCGLTLAEHQAPTRAARSPSPATAGQRREKGKKIITVFMSETRTGRNISRTKQAQL